MSYILLLNYIYLKFLSYHKNKNNSAFSLILFSFLIFIFVGFRYEIGGDWGSLNITYDKMANHGLFDGLKMYSSKFIVLIVYYFNNFEIFTETLILGCIFSFFFTKYLLSTNNFFLSLYISFPVLLIIAGMGYVHQGVAVVICWQILINYKDRTYKDVLIYTFIASLFHMSALIFLMILFLKLNNKQLKFIFLIFVYFLIFCSLYYIISDKNLFTRLLLNLNLEDKFDSYLFDDYYKSDGAVIRLLLFVPCIFIYNTINLKYLKNKKFLKLIQFSLYFILLIITITVLIRGSLFFAFADRLLIFFIFVQILIVNAYYQQYKFKDRVFIDFLVYSIPVGYLLLWMLASQYSKYWDPYKNTLFLN